MVPLKYVSNFSRKFDAFNWINCEISLQLKWSKKCILVAGTTSNQNPSFKIKDTKLFVPVATLSTQENIKFFKQIEPGFKRTINWNKYLAKAVNQEENSYLDYLTGPSFQKVNWLLVLSFEDDDDRESHN